MPPQGTFVIRDVSPENVDVVVAGFEAQGATVTKKLQPDGNYTVTAVFPTPSAAAPAAKPVAISKKARRTYGWTPDVPDQRDHTFASAPSILATLPLKVDLTPLCPEVYDQGQLGSCTANAISAAIEFDRTKQKITTFTPSRLFIYYNERAMEGTVNSDAGAQIRDGVKTVGDLGDCPESKWPYVISKFTKKPLASCYKNALKYKAVSYQRIGQSLTQMKGCLAAGYPFVFGFSVYARFESEEVANSGILNMPANDEPGAGPNGQPAGHAVLAVGYDDAEHRFIVRNSWGKTWGQKGYFTMPYTYLQDDNLASDLWTIRIVT
jgi:C1A family cysteine protease